MATPNEMMDLLVRAREMIRINSGALAVVGNSMGIMESISPGLNANALICAEINKMIEEFYADET
jgi:hypothetical protein